MEGRDERGELGASAPRSTSSGSGTPELVRPDALFAEARGALRRGDRRQARASIESLVRALEVHFALEDRVYFPALCALQPVVEPEIRRLQNEHAALRDDLTAILDSLETPADPTALTPRFEALVTTFLVHEAREEAILVAVETGLTGGGAPRTC